MNHPSRLDENKFQKQWSKMKSVSLSGVLHYSLAIWKLLTSKLVLRWQGKWMNRPLALPVIFSSVPNSEGYSELLLEYIWFSKNLQLKPNAHSNMDSLELFLLSAFPHPHPTPRKLEPWDYPHSDFSHIQRDRFTLSDHPIIGSCKCPNNAYFKPSGQADYQCQTIV